MLKVLLSTWLRSSCTINELALFAVSRDKNRFARARLLRHSTYFRRSIGPVLRKYKRVVDPLFQSFVILLHFLSTIRLSRMRDFRLTRSAVTAEMNSLTLLIKSLTDTTNRGRLVCQTARLYFTVLLILQVKSYFLHDTKFRPDCCWRHIRYGIYDAPMKIPHFIRFPSRENEKKFFPHEYVRTVRKAQSHATFGSNVSRTISFPLS